MSLKETLHIYTRVSTSSQEDGTSLETQREEGIAAAQKHEMRYKVWNEGAQSSSLETLDNRPVLSELLRLIDDGDVSHLFVWNWDRLSRHDVTSTMIRYKLFEREVTLHTSTGTQKLDDFQTKFTFKIISAMSEYDNDLRTQRLTAGKIKKIKSGGWKGGAPPYGYRLESSKLVPDAYEKKWVKEIFELYAGGASPKEISSELLKNGVITRRGKAVWSLGTIEKLLTNTHYGGYWTYEDKRSGETIRIECPAIVSNRLIHRVNLEKEKRAYRRPRTLRASGITLTHFYLLKGLLVCADCGSKYGGNKKHRQTSYYSCSGKALKYTTRGDEAVSPCKVKRNIRIDTTDSVVWQTVVEVVARSHLFKESVKSEVYKKPVQGAGKRKKKLEAKVRKISREIEEVSESIIQQETTKILNKKDSTRIQAVIKNLEHHHLKLKSDLEECYHELASIEQGGKWVDWVGKFGKRINDLKDPNFSDEEKREFLLGVVEQVSVRCTSKQTHELQIKFRSPYVGDRLEWNDDRDKSQGYSIKSGRRTKKTKVDLRKKIGAGHGERATI